LQFSLKFFFFPPVIPFWASSKVPSNCFSTSRFVTARQIFTPPKNFSSLTLAYSCFFPPPSRGQVPPFSFLSPFPALPQLLCATNILRSSHCVLVSFPHPFKFPLPTLDPLFRFAQCPCDFSRSFSFFQSRHTPPPPGSPEKLVLLPGIFRSGTAGPFPFPGSRTYPPYETPPLGGFGCPTQPLTLNPLPPDLLLFPSPPSFLTRKNFPPSPLHRFNESSMFPRLASFTIFLSK